MTQSLSFAIGCPWRTGTLDVVRVEPSGLIRLLGRELTPGSAAMADGPAICLDGEPVPFLQSFRYPRLPGRTDAGLSFSGFALEYLLAESAAARVFREMSIDLGGGSGGGRGGRLRYVGPFRFVLPEYRPLFNTEQVPHRENIYGSGAPNTAVDPQILELARQLPSPLLDFGCGGGALLLQLRRMQAGPSHGIELDLPRIRQALPPELAADVTLYDGVLPTPFADAAFRSVICSEVLEHIVDYPAAIAEMARLAAEQALFTVPDASAIPYLYRHAAVPWHLLEATHVNFFNQRSLHCALRPYFRRIEFARIREMRINDSFYYTSLAAMCWK